MSGRIYEKGVGMNSFWRRVFSTGLVAVFIATSGSLGAPSALAVAKSWDFNKAAIYTLDSCKTPTELDCIESVGILDTDGIYTPAMYLGYSSDTFKDDLGNTNVQGAQQWSVPVVTGDEILTISPNMETPSHACCKKPDGSLLRFGAIRTFVRGLSDDQRVKFVLRTSWIKPLDVPLYAAHAEFAEKKIKGGRSWTFIGGTKVSYGYQNNESGTAESKMQSFKAPADWEHKDLYFTIDHAGKTDDVSAFPTKCSNLGYTAQASNASTAGMPYWDAAAQSLNFAIEAPHLTTMGELNMGYFQFWAPVKYMNCKWPGNTLAYASRLQVSITDGKGKPEVVTTSTAGITGGIFHLNVDGMHYSSPTIKVRAVKK